MNHRKAFASAALVLVAAISVACSAAPDGVVLDREEEPQVSVTTTAATARPLAMATYAATLTCFDYGCSGSDASTLECRQLCRDSLARCVVPEGKTTGHCYVP